MKLSTFVKAVKADAKVLAKQQVKAFKELDVNQKNHYIYSAVIGNVFVAKLLLGKNKKQTFKDYMEFIAIDALMLLLDGTYQKLVKHAKEHQMEYAMERIKVIQKVFDAEETKS